MTTYIALLRAVNLAGRQPVAMAALRDAAAQVGFPGARTLLQSGNLVCRGVTRSRASLERLFETALAEHLSLETDVFVRTVSELDAVVAANPFPQAAASAPGHLVVGFLKRAPDEADVDALRAAIKGRETVHVAGTEMFAVYPDGIGRSRLTSALIERALRTRVTGRNWNTVLKLRSLAGAS
jgi:uncharacterized protein (DUF1697 family)